MTDRETQIAVAMQAVIEAATVAGGAEARQAADRKGIAAGLDLVAIALIDLGRIADALERLAGRQEARSEPGERPGS